MQRNGTLTATNLTGNADTATQLQTARNIGGVSFNGTADIDLLASILQETKIHLELQHRQITSILMRQQ